MVLVHCIVGAIGAFHYWCIVWLVLLLVLFLMCRVVVVIDSLSCY